MLTHQSQRATAPEPSTPTTDKADGANVGLVEGLESGDGGDFRITERKLLAKLQAHTALAGFELLDIGDGWSLARWGLLAHCLRNLGDVQAILARLTGRRS